MKRLILGALAGALALSVGAQHSDLKPVPVQWRKGLDTISAEDASQIVHRLAGPEFNGRSATTRDFDRAASWCADWMKANGIAPGAPNGTYFQPFSVERRRVDPGSASVSVQGASTDLKFGVDYAFQAEGSCRESIKLTFVRLPRGTSLTGLNWDRMRDSIVIIHPETAADPQSGFAEVSANQAKSLTGALAIVVPDAANGPMTVPPTTRIRESRDPLAALKGFKFTLDGARALARAAMADGFAAQNPVHPGIEFAEAEFSAKCTAETWYSTMNVVGRIPGADASLQKEAVLIGAHLDHMGVRQNGTFWGADDNASGSGAALMIGRALAANPIKPKRSVLIALWSSEELGLFGSRMYASNPSVAMEDTVAYLNMDMVGRDAEYAPFNDHPEDNRNAIYIASAEFSSPELYKFLKGTNEYIGLNLRDDKNDRTNRSDTSSFYQKGVPVLKAFTGEHKDYHKPTDTPDKINYPKMANVARWLYLSTSELASASWRPAFDANAKMLVGKAETKQKYAFSSDAEFFATLIESNPDGSGQTVIDRTSQRQAGQTPFCFALKYHTTRIDPHKMYVVRASVFDHGKLVARTISGLRVLTYNQPMDNVVVTMEQK